MAEDTARAIGAESPIELTIAGKRCALRPLTLGEIGTIERDCLSQYRDRKLESYKDSVKILPDEVAEKMLIKKVEELAEWEVSDLPHKVVHLESLKINDKVSDWIVNYLDLDEVPSDKFLKRMTTTLLDQGTLDPAQYKEMTGFVAPVKRVPYVNWWITAEIEGMVAMIYHCVKDNGVTRKEVDEEMRGDMAKLIKLAREIEALTTPSSGNGQDSVE